MPIPVVSHTSQVRVKKLGKHPEANKRLSRLRLVAAQGMYIYLYLRYRVNESSVCAFYNANDGLRLPASSSKCERRAKDKVCELTYLC